MFEPKYKLSKPLLENLLQIKNIVNDLNNQSFSDIVLAEFEKDSYALSSHASTSIEGNPLPLTDVKKILKNKPEYIRDTEKEIINYNQALVYLDALVKKEKKLKLTHTTITTIQSIVIAQLLDKKNTGKYRVDPVVVNNPKKRVVAYIPPDAVDVPRLMDELVTYINTHATDIDPLILAGIFHKQFVIIHPFIDGNGRTTRLVTKYILAHMGLDTFKLFSFENYYNKNVTRYFESVGILGDYYEINNNIDFTDWLIYFTGGIIDELLRVKKLLENINSNQVFKPLEYWEKDIINYLKKHGSISRSLYRNITRRSESTQILDFKRMIEKGFIKKVGNGKNTYYVLSK